MSTGFDRDELIGLLNRLTAGTIEPGEDDRLEGILKSHPQARKQYFAFLDMDLGLREMALSRTAEIPPPVGLAERPDSLPLGGRPRRRNRFRNFGCRDGSGHGDPGARVLLAVRRESTAAFGNGNDGRRAG